MQKNVYAFFKPPKKIVILIFEGHRFFRNPKKIPPRAYYLRIYLSHRFSPFFSFVSLTIVINEPPPPLYFWPFFIGLFNLMDGRKRKECILGAIFLCFITFYDLPVLYCLIYIYLYVD